MINPPNANNPIIEENATMATAFRGWTRSVSKLAPFTGSGSPEGVVKADQFQTYIDVDGSTGTFKYIKIQSEIGGDTSKGWVLQ